MTSDSTKSDPLSIFDDSGLEELVAIACGMRQKFVDEGWSLDQAQDIVASLYRGLARQ